MEKIQEVPIREIRVGENEQRLEKEDEDIPALAESIRRVGIISPLVVSDHDGDIHLISGHRRLLAARMAGLGVVPCIVRTSEKEMETEVTFAENFFRKDLSPVELACAIKDCFERRKMTVKELAACFHKSEHWVNSMAAIFDWPADVQEAVHVKAISVAAASNLALVTDESYRDFLLRNAVEAGATARTTSAWLQAWRQMQPAEEAITAKPVQGPGPAMPMVPQAPCLCCGQVFKVNEMSHVPMCGECIMVMRKVGTG